MRLLDLFCGAGGASVGYHRAGFDEIVGIDIKPQPRYPFNFIQADALKPPVRLEDFDAIHASPPCQAYTMAQRIQNRSHPDLVGLTRGLLRESSKLWVIENVPGAPLENPKVLEGQMFEDVRTIRPRHFETNWPLEVPLLRPSRPRQAKMGRSPKGAEWIQVVGHFPNRELAGRAMDIDWMNRDELREAIPPAYATFIGKQLIEAIRG